MPSRARRLLQDDFIRHNGVFFAGSIAVAALNYLYYPVLGRLMPVADFGDVQALLALFGQAVVLNIVFGTAILNIAANRGADDPAARDLAAFFGWLSAAFAAAVALATPWLGRVFQLGTPSDLALMAAAFPVATLGAAANSQLQAAKRFGAVSVFNLLAAGGKLVLGAALVWRGFGSSGAVAAFHLANAVAYAYAAAQAGPSLTLAAFRRPRLTPAVRAELRFGLLILCGVGIVLFLSTGDVAAVKALFPPETAGHYGGVSAIGRIVFFATASVAAVLLPHVRLEQPEPERRALLLKSVGLTAAVGAVACLPIMIAPAASVSLLLDARYLPLAPLLPWMALQSLLLALANVFIMFLIALRRRAALGVSAFGAMAAALAVGLFHASPAQVVWAFLAAAAAMLAVAAACALPLRYPKGR
jgi:O-antigen/teichoic acid export membrane protein